MNEPSLTQSSQSRIPTPLVVIEKRHEAQPNKIRKKRNLGSKINSEMPMKEKRFFCSFNL